MKKLHSTILVTLATAALMTVTLSACVPIPAPTAPAPEPTPVETTEPTAPAPQPDPAPAPEPEAGDVPFRFYDGAYGLTAVELEDLYLQTVYTEYPELQGNDDILVAVGAVASWDTANGTMTLFEAVEAVRTTTGVTEEQAAFIVGAASVVFVSPGSEVQL